MWMRIRNRLNYFFHRQRFDVELDEEMDFHRRMLEADSVRDGCNPDDAAAGAQRKFGNATLAREFVRDVWSIAWLDALMMDIRHAMREALRQPGLTLVAVLALGLGIGAASATWSLFDAVLFHPLPVKDPDRLVVVGSTQSFGRTSTSFDYRKYLSMSEADIFQGLAAGGTWQLSLAAEGPPKAGAVYFTNCDYFDTLGIHLLLGRTFLRNEDRRGAPLTAVLSYRYWQRELQGNPHVLGRRIIVAGKPATVIGVTPLEFRGLSLAGAPDIYMPLHTVSDVGDRNTNFFADPCPPAFSSPTSWITIAGRMRAASTPQQIIVRLDSQIQISPRRKTSDFSWRLFDAATAAVPEAARTSLTKFARLLGITVGLLLLIGCLSVGMLLLIRVEARSDEFALRLALGASRRRLALGVAVEGALLSLAGAVLAIPITIWLFKGLQLFELPGGVKIDWIELSVHWQVLSCATGCALVVLLAIVMVAAFYCLSTNVAEALRLSAGAAPPLTHRRMRSILVTAQVTITLVLLAGTGLFARSLMEALRLNPGFETNRLIDGFISLAQSGYSNVRAAAFYDELRGRLQGNPAISSLSFYDWKGGMTTQGQLVVDGRARRFPSMVFFEAVDEHYFTTMKMSILRGRNFTKFDSGQSPPIAVVSESLGRMLASGGNPIGRTITEPWGRRDQPFRILQVVGVVPDVITDVNSLEPLVLYLPISQNPMGTDLAIVLRAGDDPHTAIDWIGRTIRRIDVAVPPPLLRTIDEQLVRQLTPQRFGIFLLGSLGVIAMVLTVLGIYVLAESMALQRQREMGIRTALGARRRQLVWLVLSETGRLVGIGLCAGLLLAWMGASLIRAFLFRVGPLDPLTLGMVAAAMLLLALAGSLQPARYAARIDIARILREE
jgi:predicted permease